MDAGVALEEPDPAGRRWDHGGQHPQQRGLARPVRAEQSQDPGSGRHGHAEDRRGPAEPAVQVGDLDVHEAPLEVRVAYSTTAAPATATARYGRVSIDPVTAAVSRPALAWPTRTVMIQLATPAAAPTVAERATVATDRARAHTAVIGTSQLK